MAFGLIEEGEVEGAEEEAEHDEEGFKAGTDLGTAAEHGEREDGHVALVIFP